MSSDNLPEQQDATGTTTSRELRVALEARSFSGPLPPPELLAQYNQVLPGAAERIFAMAEAQQSHRHSMEKTIVAANIAAQKLGALLGFFLVLIVASCGVYLIASGKPVGGLAAIVTALSSLVAVFIYGKLEQRRDLARKAQTVSPPRTAR